MSSAKLETNWVKKGLLPYHLSRNHLEHRNFVRIWIKDLLDPEIIVN